MADCTGLPTKEDAELFKQDAGTINEVVTSSDLLTSPASDGLQKKTLAGINADADAVIDNIETAGAAAIEQIEADKQEVSDAKDQAIIDIDADIATVDSAKDSALVQIEADLATVAAEVNTINDSVASAASSESNAAQSAAEAEASALVSQSNAGFVGKWSNQTGPASVPYSVNDDTGDGENYQLLEDIADVTLSQPSLNPGQWKLIATRALTTPSVSLDFTGDIAEKVAGSFNFSRGSESTSITKTGVLVDIGNDEPTTSSAGAGVFNELTNILLYSEDIGVSPWSNADGLVDNALLISSNNSSPNPLINNAQLFEDSSTTSSQNVRQLFSGLSLTGITCQFFAKKNTSDTVGFRFAFIGDDTVFDAADYDFLTDSFDNSPSSGMAFFSEKLNDGWVKITATISADLPNTNIDFRVYPASATDITLTGRSLITKCSVIPSALPSVPYIRTSSTTDTRAADIAYIPLNDNMPVSGEPFTIEAVLSAPSYGDECFAFDIADSNVALHRKSTGELAFTVSSASDTAEVLATVDTNQHRFILSYTESSIFMYVDGVYQGSASLTGDPNYTYSDTINFYKQDASLNSEIKLFKIYDKALDSSEIAAKGAA